MSLGRCGSVRGAGKAEGARGIPQLSRNTGPKSKRCNLTGINENIPQQYPRRLRPGGLPPSAGECKVTSCPPHRRIRNQPGQVWPPGAQGDSIQPSLPLYAAQSLKLLALQHRQARNATHAQREEWKPQLEKVRVAFRKHAIGQWPRSGRSAHTASLPVARSSR